MRILLIVVVLVCLGTTQVYAQFVSQENVLEDGLGSGLNNRRSVPDGQGGYYLAGSQHDARGLLVHVDSSFTLLSSTVYSGGAWPIVFPDMVFDDIERIGNGDLVLCGQVTDTATGKVNALLMQCDSAGSVVWARQLSGTGLYSRFVAVSACGDGGFICTGNLFNPITTQPGQLLVTRTDSAGQVLWSKAFTGLNHENSGREVLELADGGFLLTGFTENLNPFEGSTLIMKLDSAGAVIQSARIQITGQTGFTLCAGSDLVNMASGPVVYMSTTSGIALARVNSAFQSLQVSSFTGGGSGGGFSSTAYPGFHVLHCLDGGFIFSSRSGFYGELVKVDSAGNLQWSSQVTMLLNDAFLQADGSTVLVGEGPLLGVAPPSDHFKTFSLLPQIGLQRTDSMAQAGNCVQPGTTIIDPSNPAYAIAPFPVSVATAGTLQPTTVNTSALPVLSRSGCVDVVGGGEELISEKNIRVFPNPASDKFNIEHAIPGKVRMILTDVQGRKMLEMDILPAGAITTITAPLPGMYYIVLDNGERRKTRRLLIIR